MRESFNLLREPWIPALTLDNEEVELNLLEIFEQAHRLRSLASELPSMDFAILRLLLAIFARDFFGSPEDDHFERWSELWRQQRFQPDDITDYLVAFEERFDLLSHAQPFWQVADLRTAKDETKSVSLLMADVPAGHRYFTVRAGQSTESMSFAEAARWLVHTQNYDISGIKSGAVGDPRVKGGKGYPIGTGWTGALGGIYLVGSTLYETLVLNVPVPGFSTIDPPPTHPDNPLSYLDLPFWERPQLTASPEDRGSYPSPSGPVDLLTWSSRRIRLVHNGEQVTSALICNGDTFPGFNQFDEPFTRWRYSPNASKKENTEVHYPLRLSEDRGSWNGLASLLATQSSSSRDVRPGVLRGIDALRANEAPVPERLHVQMLSMHYGPQSSTFADLVTDNMTFHAALLNEKSEATVQNILAVLNQTDELIWHLGIFVRNLQDAAGASHQSSVDVAEEQSVKTQAYASLSVEFKNWISRLTPENETELVREWRSTVAGHINAIVTQALSQVSPQAIAGRQVQRKNAKSDDDTFLLSAASAHMIFAKAHRGFVNPKEKTR